MHTILNAVAISLSQSTDRRTEGQTIDTSMSCHSNTTRKCHLSFHKELIYQSKSSYLLIQECVDFGGKVIEPPKHLLMRSHKQQTNSNQRQQKIFNLS